MTLFKNSKFLFVILLTLLLNIPTFSTFNSIKASAASVPGNIKVNYYMDTVDTQTYYDMGYSMGKNDLNAPGTQDTLAILFVGAQTPDGATLFGINATRAEIANAVKEFSHGYWLGVGSDYDSILRVVVSTSNNLTVSKTYGENWAKMVNDIGSYNNDKSYSSQVSVYGGIDIEGAWCNRQVEINSF